MTHSLLLEVGIEDMPAHVIVNAEKQLVTKTKALLNEANLSFGEVTGFSTPRRFTVKIDGLAEKQPDENLTVRGPAQRIAQDEEGNWSRAAIGFSKGQGGSVEDLVIKDDNGEPYVYIEKFIAGKTALDILKDLSKVVESIEFPKNMKWGVTNYQYVRPIHWLVALLDDQVIPFEVFEVETGKETQGHRFLGNPVTINHPDEYEEKLAAEFVVADRSKRQAMIIKQLEELCDENQWAVPTQYPDLLEEVTDLVEYPTVFYGSFNESFLNVPEPVLVTSMIDHQRYFPVHAADDSTALLPYFISVRNGNADHIENVAKGNEKVLSARLADAKFFYDEDQKSTIADFNEKLKRVVYHDKLGTIYEKQERASKMVETMNRYFDLTADEIKQLERVTSIYKFDLVTQVVDELPTLQGYIGQLYASERDEDTAVATAIGEQYLPLSITDDLPTTKIGKLIALTDKLDSLIQFFSVGLIPTGSNDPYALRRQAIGVVRLLLDLDDTGVELDAFINDLFEAVELPEDRLEDLEVNKAALLAFIGDRLEQIMQSEYKITHDQRKAALGSTHYNLKWILDVALELKEQKEAENFKETVESITRVLNMTKKHTVFCEVDQTKLETESEKALAEQVVILQKGSKENVGVTDRFNALAEISPYISDFFENNMIMVDDESVKENRLNLLGNIAESAKQFADFSQLVI